VQLNIK